MMSGRWRTALIVVLMTGVTSLLAAAALAAPTRLASAQDDPTSTSTTLPVDNGNQSVIPLPNSGTRPESSGDRGGWEQLLLFGIMTAGCVVIFGRVLWAAHQRSRANALPAGEEARPRA